MKRFPTMVGLVISGMMMVLTTSSVQADYQKLREEFETYIPTVSFDAKPHANVQTPETPDEGEVDL